jgi:hypothetical protein
MSLKLDRLGGWLLSRFVPSIEASAGCTPRCYAKCWQCNYRPCTQYANCSVTCNG